MSIRSEIHSSFDMAANALLRSFEKKNKLDANEQRISLNV